MPFQSSIELRRAALETEGESKQAEGGRERGDGEQSEFPSSAEEKTTSTLARRATDSMKLARLPTAVTFTSNPPILEMTSSHALHFSCFNPPPPLLISGLFAFFGDVYSSLHCPVPLTVSVLIGI